MKTQYIRLSVSNSHSSLPTPLRGRSVPPPHYIGLGHVTCFGQLDVSRCEASRCLKVLCNWTCPQGSCLSLGKRVSQTALWSKEAERSMEQSWM